MIVPRTSAPHQLRGGLHVADESQRVDGEGSSRLSSEIIPSRASSRIPALLTSTSSRPKAERWS